MVTRNDVIRSELQIADLQLARQVVTNNINIVNKQLTTATGLPSTTVILPDTSILTHQVAQQPLSAYEAEAIAKYPSVRAAAVNTAVAENNVQIVKSDLLPQLSAYVGSNLQRPVTSTSPAADLYSHGWQTGLTLSFNIDAVYKAPQNIKLNKLYLQQRKEQEALEVQN